MFCYTLLSYEYKSLDDLLQGNRGMDLFQTLKVNDSERPFRVRGMELIYYLYFLSIYYFLLFVRWK